MAVTRTTPVYVKEAGRLVLTDELRQGDSAAVLGSNSVLAKVFYRAMHKNGTGYVQTEALSQMDLQTVPIPANFAGLEAEMMPPRLQNQLFRIYELEENEDYVTIRARHVWYDNRENFTLWKPGEKTTYTAAAICRNILGNAVSEVSSQVESDCTDTKVGKDLDFERKNLVEAFLDPEKGVCELFGLSLIRDNWDFYCLKEVGYDRGFVVQNGKNLLGVERKESLEKVATRIIPIGKDEKGEIKWLNWQGHIYIDSQYIDDYSYPRAEMYDTGIQIGKDDVTAGNYNDKLLEAAQKHLREDKVDLPEVEMKIEFLSLGDTEEYAQYRGLDKVYLYDILTIKDTERGYNYAAQVIGVEHDILTGMLNSVTIGSITNADAKRKIAVWQVPEVSGTNIRLKSILAGSFESGAIQTEDIADHVIAYAHIAQATIDELTTDALTAAYAQIHELIAGRITAEDIQAGSITSIVIASNAITADKIEAAAVTAEKLAADSVTADKILAGAVTAVKIAADAVTAEKIAANAVTAGKIAAGAINADKIDATQISAINAKLGTASIADARIALADIDFAKVKDLNAQSAFFGEAVFQEAIGGKLFVPRLMVGYAQMVQATVGDLVIKATNDNYYHLDVDEETGAVTATQVYPSAEEIEDGHTEDGQTIIDTDIVAENLSTANIYATHALMDEINANIINVDNLFAREATIAKINAMDLSSNTYIRSTIGDWQSGSTITQTINGINSRITSLGYGTIFYQTTEPDPAGVVVGDVWIEPIDDNTWDQIAVYTWEQLEGWTWDQVAGQYRMYVWDGQQWKLLYDNLIVSELMTEINQTAYAVTLKADKSVVDTLSDDVSAFSATLEVQAEQISAAVSSVNQKVASYTQLDDPAEDPEISLSTGDTWVKAAGDGTWAGLESYTWDELANLTWDELAGASVYTWDGTEWIQTTNYGYLVQNRTMILQTQDAILLEAEKREQLGDTLNITRAELTVANDRISAEVIRATTAEGGKIDKTSQYQTADAIVTEAVRQSGVNANANYILKTTTYQTAESIVTEAVRQSGVNAANGFLAKTTSYQTADAIVTEAVRQAGANAGSAYIAKTSIYQTADAIVSEAVRQSTAAASGAFIQKTNLYQSADAIVLTAESYADGKANTAENNAKTYAAGQATAALNDAKSYVSSIGLTAAGVDIVGSKHINLDVDGNNYIHMSNAGIDMKGSRVTVDGNAMWARDDIIVMNPNDQSSWRRTVAGIEAHMSGKHDWVLIKPYYDATIVDKCSQGDRLDMRDEVNNTSYFVQEDYGFRAFGNGSDWYQYDVDFVIENQSDFRQVNIGIYLANTPFTFSSSADKASQAAAHAQVILTQNNVPVGGEQDTRIQMSSGHVGYNLFGDGATIYYYIYGLGVNGWYMKNFRMTGTTDLTTGKRVPCSTYYYS